MRSVWVICLPIIFVSNIFGIDCYAEDGVDLAVASFTCYNKVKVENPQKNTFEEDMKVGVSILNTQLSYPVALSNNETFLINGLNFQQLILDYENWDVSQSSDNSDEFYMLEYEFALQHKIDDRLSLIGILRPALVSDLEQISMADLRINAGIVFDRSFGLGKRCGIGVGYSSNLGEPLIFPVFSYAQVYSDKFRFKLIVPVLAELWYEFSPRIELGLVSRLIANQYRINRIGTRADKFRYFNASVGPSLRLFLDKNVNLSFDGGITFFHRFQLYDRNEKIRAIDLRNSWFIKLGFNFSV